MRISELEMEDLDGNITKMPSLGFAACHEDADTVLDTVNEQLKAYDLKVVRYDTGCDTFAWTIKKT